MIRRMLLIALVCLAVVCFVNVNSAVAFDTGQAQITELRDFGLTTIPGLLVHIDVQMSALGCAGGSYYYALDGSTSNANYKTEVAMLMAAYLSGRPIRLLVTGPNEGGVCYWDIPKITGVFIY